MALALLSAKGAFAQAPDVGHAPHEWPHAFPIWGPKLAQRGVDFMLPWGVGINYAFVDQPIEISRVAVGVNDSEMVDLSEMIEFGEVRSQLHAMNARMDLWVLPFLNVYALGNAVIEAKTDVSITEPFSLLAGSTQNGGGGGFGTTLAAGAFGFFGTIDMNWTWNKLSKLDAPVGTFLLTPRVGKNFGKVWGIETIFWVGAMMQKIQADTDGQIRLSDTIDGSGEFKDELVGWYNELPPGQQAIVRGIVGRLDGAGDAVIRYDLDKHVAHPWNMVVGTELGLTRAWRLRCEVGFIGRTQVIVGVNYRFGDFFRKPTQARAE